MHCLMILIILMVSKILSLSCILCYANKGSVPGVLLDLSVYVRLSEVGRVDYMDRERE